MPKCSSVADALDHSSEAKSTADYRQSWTTAIGMPQLENLTVGNNLKLIYSKMDIIK
jgi:hypothetical protein